MTARAGSWRPLLLAAGAFLLAFAAVRAGSGALRIEADAARWRPLARALGIGLADILALHELLGADTAPERVQAACRAYAAERGRCGDAFAAMLASGRDLASIAAALTAHPGDAGAAWRAFAPTPPALPGLRFLELRRRFGERAAARN